MSRAVEDRLIGLLIEELDMLPFDQSIPPDLVKKAHFWMGKLERRRGDLVFKSMTMQKIAEALRRHAHQRLDEIENEPRCENGLANARLIAAAPELYEALAAILASDGLNSDNAARALAAISKAEGRS